MQAAWARHLSTLLLDDRTYKASHCKSEIVNIFFPAQPFYVCAVGYATHEHFRKEKPNLYMCPILDSQCVTEMQEIQKQSNM